MLVRIKYIFVIISCLLVFFDASSQTRMRRSVENRVLTAVEKMNDGNLQGAEDMLKDIVEVDPSCDAAWYYLGNIAISRSDLETAQVYTSKAVNLDPKNFWYRYRLAQLHAVSSREAAIEMYESLIRDFPKKSDLYFEMLDLYLDQKEYDKALLTIDEIEKVIGPTDHLAIYAYRIYYALGREEEGLEYLRKYNNRYSSPIVLSILADSELTMYNDSLAISYYDEAIDLDPTYSHALLGKAEACRMFRRYEEYFPALNRYVESASAPVSEKTDYLSTIVSKSEPQFIKRFMPQLDTTLQRLSRIHPSDSLVYNLRGVYYYYTGREDASLEQFRECAAAYPESFQAAATYIDFLMYTQRWKELSEEGRKTFERFPQETAFLEMAGVGDYNLGEYEKVLETCDKVLKIAPSDSSKTIRSWSTKGDVLHLLGENKKAYKAYEKALKINPDYVYVLNNYAYYLSMEGKKLNKAYEMSRKTVEAAPDNATYLDTFGWILYLRGEYSEAKSRFKTAMLHGGKDSAVILDHYAEVLFALKEYDLALVYWNLALQKNEADNVPGLKQKVEQKRKEIGR